MSHTPTALDDHFSVQGTVRIEVVRGVLQLQSTEQGNKAKHILKPGVYEFYFATYLDGRPEKNWVVLISNRSFGTPDTRLDSLVRTGVLNLKD